jgi:hypothetical protein
MGVFKLTFAFASPFSAILSIYRQTARVSRIMCQERYFLRSYTRLGGHACFKKNKIGSLCRGPFGYGNPGNIAHLRRAFARLGSAWQLGIFKASIPDCISPRGSAVSIFRVALSA